MFDKECDILNFFSALLLLFSSLSFLTVFFFPPFFFPQGLPPFPLQPQIEARIQRNPNLASLDGY